MIVAKFGGTSVTDSEAIGRLIDIVRGRIVDQPVVVVSALAGVTDRLLSLAAEAETEESGTLDQALRALLDRHVQIAHSLPGADGALDSILADGETLRLELKGLRDRSPTPAQLDAIAARGELWSSRLVAGALGGCRHQCHLDRHPTDHGD